MPSKKRTSRSSRPGRRRHGNQSPINLPYLAEGTMLVELAQRAGISDDEAGRIVDRFKKDIRHMLDADMTIRQIVTVLIERRSPRQEVSRARR